MICSVFFFSVSLPIKPVNDGEKNCNVTFLINFLVGCDELKSKPNVAMIGCFGFRLDPMGLGLFSKESIRTLPENCPWDSE